MDKEDVIIKQLPEGGFNVVYGDKYTGILSYDEMLGVVSAITMPKERPCLNWLWTEAQHYAFNERYNKQNTTLESWQKLLPANTSK